MSFYECVFIVRQDVPSSQVEQLVSNITEIVRGQQGQVVRTEMWGLKTLAYKIKKNRKGHYVMLYIDAPGSVIAELERNLRINEDILRYLTIQVEELSKEPSVMMQTKGEYRPGRREDDEFSAPRPGSDEEFETATDEGAAA